MSRLLLYVLFGLCLSAGAASGQDADGWRPARPEDFVDTAWQAERAARAAYALGVTGDFDGDGRRDAARLMVNRRLGLYAVSIDLRRVAGLQRVTLATAPLYGLEAAGLDVRPGRPDTLVIFTFGGARQFVTFRDGRVRTRWD